MMRAADFPVQIWVEMHDPNERDACDVIVKMENGQYYAAVFVTLPYLARQMDLSYEMCKEIPYATPVRYAALETPHILISRCDRESIEDTIDNLLMLDVFENLFTQVTEDEDLPDVANGKRATTEVAAVVVSEVLLVDDRDRMLATTVA
ncbi:MAG: hypothetical protein L6Q98_07555 [Anaerolineae bacterium]|nr:hypothetical protein [Anaerolineae bacterium]MCK6577946.1 hypothetical protein [Anaerolineae bacterium]NUQ04639.1 hypothetical protein [Anaerolineae bacterium]